MQRATVLTVLLAVLLGGCQSAGDRAFMQATSDCTPPGETRSSIECVKKHPNFNQFSPDAQRFVHYTAAVHEKRRTGKLTTNEADLLSSEYMAQIDRERASAAAVQQQASSAAMAQTGAALIAAGAPRPAPVYQQPQPMTFQQPIQTNCSPNGKALRREGGR